jgi:hypothetical protein
MRKTLGPNINPESGMMAAMGWSTPKPLAPIEPTAPADASPAPTSLDPAAAPLEAAAPPKPPRQEPRRPATPRSRRPPEKPAPTAYQEPTFALLGPVARVPTDIDRHVLNLARRAAHWNRETLRSFLERAIRDEADRIASDLQFDDGLPEAPPLPHGPRPGS